MLAAVAVEDTPEAQQELAALAEVETEEQVLVVHLRLLTPEAVVVELEPEEPEAQAVQA